MAASYRLALIRERVSLVEDLRFEIPSILDHLLADSVISIQEHTTVVSKETAWNQTRATLDIIQQKNDSSIEAFLRILRDKCGLDEVYTRLTEAARRLTTEELQTSSRHDGFDSSLGHTGVHLQAHLQENLGKKFNEWVNSAVESMGSGDYIEQPITAQKKTSYEKRQVEATDICQLLEQSAPGDRIFLDGDAGMGKTRLVRHLAESWAGSKTKPAGRLATLLASRFKVVCPVPLRLVKGRENDPLEDILCQDVKLFPVDTDQSELRKVLESNDENTLYLLDSLEELSVDAECINKLIRRELFPKATVIITSRSCSRFTEAKQKVEHHTEAQLQFLAEEKVEQFMSQYLKQDIVHNLGTSFLQRPVNMMLIGYLLSKDKLLVPTTQTGIFSLLTQYVAQVYAKKKNYSGADFDVIDGSPLDNRCIPLEVKHLLEKMSKLCYEALLEKRHFLTLSDNLQHTELMAFGLFGPGPDENSVTLPHQLFLEYFAAIHIIGDEPARNELMETISKAWLPVLDLQNRGMENVVRFMMGLSSIDSIAAKQLAETGVLAKQLQKKFIRIDRDMFFFDLSYQLALIEECVDKELKMYIALSLLNSPIIVNEILFCFFNAQAAHALLGVFNEEKQVEFMKRVYGCEVFIDDDGQSVIRRLNGEICGDSYIVAYADMHDSYFQMDELCIVNCNVAIRLLAKNMSGIRKLHIISCTLSLDDPYNTGGRPVTGNMPLFREKPHQYLNLIDVDGLHNLSGIAMPHVCSLMPPECDSTSLDILQQSCQHVQSMTMIGWDFNDINLFSCKSWDTVEKLVLENEFIDGADFVRFQQVFPNVKHVRVDSRSTFEHVEDTKPWHDVELLEFWNQDAPFLGAPSFGVPEINRLQYLFPGVWELGLEGAKLPDSTDDTQWEGITSLHLVKWGEVSLGELGKLQSVFTHVKWLEMKSTRLVNDGMMDDDSRWDSVTALQLTDCLNLDQSVVALLQRLFPRVKLLFLNLTGISDQISVAWDNVEGAKLPDSTDDTQWEGITSLHLGEWGKVSLGEIGKLQSVFTHVKRLEMWSTRLVNDTSLPNATWGMVKMLELDDYGKIDKSEFKLLQRVFPEVNGLILDSPLLSLPVDGWEPWSSVSNLNLLNSEDMDLKEILQLKNIFPSVTLLGFSNHTLPSDVIEQQVKQQWPTLELFIVSRATEGTDAASMDVLSQILRRIAILESRVSDSKTPEGPVPSTSTARPGPTANMSGTQPLAATKSPRKRLKAKRHQKKCAQPRTGTERAKFLHRKISHKWIIDEKSAKTKLFLGEVTAVLDGNDGDPDTLYFVDYGDDGCYDVNHLLEDYQKGDLTFVAD